MKKILLFLLVLSISVSMFSAEKITGVWKSVSDETGLISSVCLVYEYNQKMYGRLLVTYEADGTIGTPEDKALALEGEPAYAGLDFIWDMQDKGKKWSKGKILDPVPGKTYSCDMWIENGNLMVKGKIGPFGRSQTWLPVTDRSELPEWANIPESPTPVIPKAK